MGIYIGGTVLAYFFTVCSSIRGVIRSIVFIYSFNKNGALAGMKNGKNTEIWDLWYPKAGSTGISFGRGSLEATGILLVHAAPQILSVSIYKHDGNRIALGEDLDRKNDTPIAKLTRKNGDIERDDIWPTENEIGCAILLPGGEVGILQKWWNAPDFSEWRWQIELYNHK
jgi:hypothetical protein